MNTERGDRKTTMVTPRVCLVTTGQPSTNPRLVKEADALTEAGYDVHVVATRFLTWASEADIEFQDRKWTITHVDFGEMATGLWGELQRGRRLFAQYAVMLAGMRRPLVVRAIHYVVPELTRAATRKPADLYIAHNLAALPAAAAAARAHGARLGFDAEDFHRGELGEADQQSLFARMIRWVEEAYIPQCDYVTAASDGIADAYADVLGISRPTTILNVFPSADRDVVLPIEEIRKEKCEETTSLYWFSQTIGKDRGLEEVVDALADLPDRVALSLRGNWANGFEAQLRGRAKLRGVGGRIRHLGPAAPSEMVARAACHDIGLALEQTVTLNRRICVTNKIFTYLLAGLPAIATDTPGQHGVAMEVGSDVVPLVEPADSAALSRAIRKILDEGGTVLEAIRTRASLAGDRYNWDAHKKVFLDVVERTLDGSSNAARSAD